MPEVKCIYRVDNDKEIFCLKKKTTIPQPYLCSKNQCSDCHFPTLATITIDVGRCDECPFHDTDRTRGAGDAYDYFCKAKNGKKISGYIEYRDELPPVPAWCPFYLNRKDGIK